MEIKIFLILGFLALTLIYVSSASEQDGFNAFHTKWCSVSESFKNLHLFYTFYIKMDLDRPFKFVQDLTALLMEKR